MGLIGKMLQPLENGLPIKFTTGLHTGCTKLLVPSSSNIKSIADLKGKKIGVPGPVSYTHLDVYKRQVLSFFIDFIPLLCICQRMYFLSVVVNSSMR